LPLVYLLSLVEVLRDHFYIIYMVAMLIIAALFVIKIKVKKPGLKEMYVFIGIGLVIGAVILISALI
jgi:CDP-diacylglycerol--serine O-phosphatidyltransferase